MKTLVNLIKYEYLVNKKSEADIMKELDLTPEAVEFALKGVKRHNQSDLEKSVGDCLKQIFPKLKIIPQHPIGPYRLDYYIKDIRLGIEVQGIQHTKITPFFHGKTDFSRHVNFSEQIERDENKIRLAKENSIHLIHINYDEKISTENIRRIINEHWSEIIRNLDTYRAKTGLFQTKSYKLIQPADSSDNKEEGASTSQSDSTTN